MHQVSSSFSQIARVIFMGAFLGVVLILAGCGDGHSPLAFNPTPTPTPTPTPVPSAAVQLRIGDAPADQLLDFEVTIVNPIVATLSTGENVKVEVGSNRLELSHTAGKLEPLSNLSFPQGTYKSVEITLSDPAITYVYSPASRFQSYLSHDPELVSRDFPGTQTVTINFDTPAIIDANASVLNLDVNIAKALVFNPDDGQEITGVNFTPANFLFSREAIAPSDKQQHKTGELESVWGTVSAVSGSSFVLNAGQSGAVFQITTTSTTQFHDSLKGINDVLGRLIEVEGYTQSDGTMVADEIELLADKTGASIEGVILDAGNGLIDRNILNFAHQADSFTMLAQDGTGNGARNDDVGWTFTVHTGYLTDRAYGVDYGKCDWSGLGTDVPGPLFPFDSHHLFPGQRVGIVTSSALPNSDFAHFTATRVELQQQAVTGEIVYYHSPTPEAIATLSFNPNDSTWFVLRLPEDSYVRALSGRAFVLVYQGATTDIEYLPNNTDKVIGVGTVARVRGLMFAFAGWYPNDSSVSLSHDGGILTMIARRVTEQESAPVPATATK